MLWFELVMAIMVRVIILLRTLTGPQIIDNMCCGLDVTLRLNKSE